MSAYRALGSLTLITQGPKDEATYPGYLDPEFLWAEDMGPHNIGSNCNRVIGTRGLSEWSLIPDHPVRFAGTFASAQDHALVTLVSVTAGLLAMASEGQEAWIGGHILRP